MKKQVLFIHGGGDGGYEADTALVVSLQAALGREYEINYPKILPDETIEDVAPLWLNQIDKALSADKNEIILTGHSLGGSMLLKYLSENKIRENIAGIFLIAPPFWSGDQDWVQPLKLQKDFSDKLQKDIPIFFYQCKDDDVVPFDHFTIYQQNVPWATFREIESGGHQLDNDLSLVAKDIKEL